MVQALVLAVPNFDLPFVLETYASDYGIGAVLMQANHLVAYLSKHLCPRIQALSVYEKECLAILMAIEKWRPYLQHNKFLIRTNHKSLLHLTKQRVTSKIQHKAMVKLMDLDYQIQYKKGINNAIVDALSRYVTDQGVLAMLECISSWVQKLREGYEESKKDKKVLAELAISSTNDKSFELKEGITIFQGRIWVGHNTLAQ